MKKLIIAITLAAAFAAPAMANYDRCYENPSATGCPGDYNVTKEPSYVAPHSYKGASHEPSRAARHNG